jgi:hypothetical protein
MRRTYLLPTTLVLLAAALVIFALWNPAPSAAQSDSPIVVSDGASIHFRRIVPGHVIQPDGPRWKVAESGRRVQSIEVAGGGGNINLTAGWTVRLMDGSTEAGAVRSTDNGTISIDPEGHAPAPAASAAEVFIPQFHLRSIVVQNGGGGGPRTFTCATGAECFRIHYR